MQNDFEKSLVDALLEYADKAMLDKQHSNTAYQQQIYKAEKVYKTIESSLPRDRYKLINRYDSLKNVVSSYEVGMAYEQGMKDGVRILKMLEVI